MKYSQTMKLDLGFRRMNKKHMQECAASTNLSLHLDVGDSYLCAAEFHSATWGDNDPNWQTFFGIICSFLCVHPTTESNTSEAK
jgi:hypothetical protein